MQFDGFYLMYAITIFKSYTTVLVVTNNNELLLLLIFFCTAEEIAKQLLIV